jgi:hypothetical protein
MIKFHINVILVLLKSSLSHCIANPNRKIPQTIHLMVSMRSMDVIVCGCNSMVVELIYILIIS